MFWGSRRGAYEDALYAAEGKIIGRVREVFSVTLSQTYTEKVEIGRKMLSFGLNFFKKEINILKRTSKNASDYVIIKRKERLSLPGGLLLPFGYTVCEAVFYETRECEYSRADATREGMDLLEQRIRTATKDGEMLSQSFEVREENGSLVLYATVEYTQNIAKRLPFSVG